MSLKGLIKFLVVALILFATCLAVHSAEQEQEGAVLGWGDNHYGQANVPAGLHQVVSVAAGNGHAVAALADGTVRTWGGQRGQPSKFPPGLTNVAKVAAGADYTVFLLRDGTVLSYGLFASGEYFRNTSDAVAISAGFQHFVALKADGHVLSFGGYARYDKPMPSGGVADAVGIAAGTYHTLAVRRDGTVVGWGRNDFGQCDPPSGLGDVAAVAAGNYHSIALKHNGTVISWGANTAFGETLNQGTTPAGLANVVAVAAGANHNLALKNDGSIVTWGAPMTVPERLSGAVAVASGSASGTSFAITPKPVVVAEPRDLILTEGAIAELRFEVNAKPPFQFEWTFNGQRLEGRTESMIAFNPVRFENRGLYQAVASNSHGSVTSRVAQVTVSRVPEVVIQPVPQVVLTGTGFMLRASAIGASPLRYQWTRAGAPVPGATGPELRIDRSSESDGGEYAVIASNAFGETTSSPANVQVVSSGPVVKWGWPRLPNGLRNLVAVDGNLGLRADGRVMYWDWSNGNTTEIEGLTNIIQIAAGDGFWLALREDGVTLAWNFFNLRPEPLAGFTNVISIATGDGALAARQDGTVVSAGGSIQTPIGLSGVKSVTAEFRHRLALKNDGTVVGWGQNTFGQISIPAGLSGVREIATGPYHTLALLTDGTVRAWGMNNFGQCDPPSGLRDVIAIAAGSHHSLALTSNGELVAWGNPDAGATSIPAGLRGIRSIAAQGNANIVILDWPVFLEEPKGFELLEGGSAILRTRVASVAPHTLQWQLNGVDILGETAETLQIISARRGNAGNYRVVARTESGATTSQPAFLNVLTAPLIESIPTRIDVANGATAKIVAQVYGAAPITFRWFFGEALIATTTVSEMTLSNVNLSMSGLYSFTASNYLGVARSSFIDLAVHFPPAIVRQPNNLKVASGETAIFDVSAMGEGTLSYQWHFNDAPIAGETDPTLEVMLVQPRNEGSYFVAVANEWGRVESRRVTLMVTNDLAAAVTTQSLGFTTGGDNVWRPQSRVRHDDITAAESGQIQDGQSVWMETTLNRSGTLSFWWRVSSEEGYDFLAVEVNGVEIARISGETDWRRESVQVPVPGWVATVRWVYRKDGSLRAGSDTAWVDGVEFELNSAPAILSQPGNLSVALGETAVFRVLASGHPDVTYAWWRNDQPIAGANQSVYKVDRATQADAGIYRVTVSNSEGFTNSRDAELQVRAKPVFTRQPVSRIGFLGGGIDFEGVAVGSGPISYQWFFEGIPLHAQTHEQLYFQEISAEMEGGYRLRAENSFGEQWSELVTLTIAKDPMVIDFEDVVAPCLFAQAHAVSDRYLAKGVTILGASNVETNIAAIMAGCANSGMSGYSGENFLLLRPDGITTEGPSRLPIAFKFNHPVNAFQAKIAGWGATASLEAFDEFGNTVQRMDFGVLHAARTITINGEGIVKVVMSGNQIDAYLVDDLMLADVADIAHLPVKLSVERSGNSLQLSWPSYGAGKLMEAMRIDAPTEEWRELVQEVHDDGFRRRLIVPMLDRLRFYRLVR